MHTCCSKCTCLENASPELVLLNAKLIANSTLLKHAMIKDNDFAKCDMTGKYSKKVFMCLASTGST